jgi:hypothetical protein
LQSLNRWRGKGSKYAMAALGLLQGWRINPAVARGAFTQRLVTALGKETDNHLLARFLLVGPEQCPQFDIVAIFLSNDGVRRAFLEHADVFPLYGRRYPRGSLAYALWLRICSFLCRAL